VRGTAVTICPRVSRNKSCFLPRLSQNAISGQIGGKQTGASGLANSTKILK